MKTLFFCILVFLPKAAFSQTPKDFTAHEWGTFTSVQGSNGESLPWRPLKTSDLPSFVYDWSQPGLNRFSSGMFLGKGNMVTLQRMETPVIYFYSGETMNVDVSVAFPLGLITEWYPQAAQIGPSLPGDTNRSNGALPESRASWRDLKLVPLGEQYGGRFPTPEDQSGSHYYAARRVPSCLVRAKSVEETNRVDEVEKFIFYRGAGSFKTPLKVTVDSNNVVNVSNTGTDRLAHLFLVSIHNGAGRFEYKTALASGQRKELGTLTRYPVDRPGRHRVPLSQFQKKIREQMEEALICEGLFAAEARAMVDTWEDSWFAEEGDRVLYILPHSWTDETLPITFSPTPTNLIRVMVGRSEIISPDSQHELANLLAKAAAGNSVCSNLAIVQLKKLGRFAEAAVQLADVRQTTSSQTNLFGPTLLAATASPLIEKLQQLYTEWHDECLDISYSSDTRKYISLPGYRKLADIGKPALPFLVEKMKADRGMDFMLASAACEICGWNEKDFIGGGEQSFRDRILRKLEATPLDKPK